MKNAILTTLFLIAISITGVENAVGQITINLPNIKKIIKPDPNTSQVVNTNPTTTTHNNNTATGNGSTNWWVDYQIGKINEYKQSLASWNPANQVFPRPNSSDDYINLALSKKERTEWLQSKKVAPDAKLDAWLDD
jgi:hypothetical protein